MSTATVDKRTDPVMQTVSGWRWAEGQLTEVRERVAGECAVAIAFNDRPFAVMMMTPTELEAFVLGFSLSEGIIAHPQELLHVDVRTVEAGIQIDARVPAERALALADRQRALSGRSGCGLCGASSLEQAVRSLRAVPDTLRMTHRALQAAMARVAAGQPLNEATGGVHAAAWTLASGEVVRIAEDVGRHNALDKLIGALCREQIGIADGALLLTSRASHEMVQKAATLGMQIVCAVSAPSTLAIRQAERCGVTLVAFARDGRHTVYSHPVRLT